MKKLTLIISVLMICFSAKAQIFSGTYPFDSVKATSGLIDPTPLPTATGVTFGSFSATGTPANPNAAGRFSFTNWALGATDGDNVYANLTGSVNTSEYYEVTITPVAGYTMTLTDITFTFGRSSTGVRTYSVRSDADSYVNNLAGSISPANPNLSVQAGDVFFLNTDFGGTTSQTGSTITLGGASYMNLTVPRTFRFYGWNAEGTGGTYSIDNVTINGSVTAPTVLTAIPSSDVSAGCEDLAVNFTDLSSGPDPIVAWSWDFDDGSPLDNTMNPSHTYTSAGTYTVTLTVTDNAAASDSETMTITVYEKPIAGFTGPTLTCAGTIAQFLDGSTIATGSIVGWDWNFGDPASGAANTSMLEDPQHTYYTQTNYTVTEIVTSDMGCKDTSTVFIYNDSIGVSYTFMVTGPTVDFTGNVWGGNPAYTFMWDFGDGGFSTVFSPSYTYSSTGVYTVCFTVFDANGCSDTTCGAVTIITTGINEKDAVDISLHPNPSNNGLFELNTLNSTKTTIRVFNILGEQILAKEISAGKTMLDLSAEPNGNYFIRIQTDKENITKKIVISR